MGQYDVKHLSIRYDITDRALFQPERERMFGALGGTIDVPGAKVTAAAVYDVFSYEQYALYLLDYIDQGIDRDENPPLEFEDWEKNGEPASHDRDKEYEREEEG